MYKGKTNPITNTADKVIRHISLAGLNLKKLFFAILVFSKLPRHLPNINLTTGDAIQAVLEQLNQLNENIFVFSLKAKLKKYDGRGKLCLSARFSEIN